MPNILRDLGLQVTVEKILGLINCDLVPVALESQLKKKEAEWRA